MNSVPDTTSRPETGANIRRIRIRLGLSQHEAGALLKVGSDAFDRYERGLAEPGGPAGQLLKLLVLRPELLADLRGFEDRSDSFTPSPGLASLLLFWGKARPETPDILWHPLVYHGLDVAAAGHALVEERGLPHGLASAFGDRWSGILGYLLALHDIGKLSRPFQGLSETHWPEAVLGPHQPPAAGLRHDALGLTLLDRLLGTKAKRRHPLADWRPDDWEPALALLRPVVAHHGRPVSKADIKVFDPELEAGHDFLDLMTTLFDPDLPPPTEALTVLLPRVSWELAGLTVLADWIGSRQAWFPYHPNTIDPMRYWRDVALPQARQAVAAAGLASNRPNPVTGYRVLTGLEHPPSPIQHWAETVPLPQGPVLALIEDMTGSGKTEAALILAHRLIAGGRAHGLYLALPTMATANAMYRRLSKTYRRLFAIEATPSLALAHGAAALNSGFRDSVKALATSVRSDDRCDENEPGGDGAGASCAAWIADSRRKTFLADVGVGTIDQALLAVLPAKYQALRLLGLGRQVLVIDEAHAYDTYMGTELERLLEFQAALGGNAVVLSATLPQAKRQALAKAFAKGLGAPSPAPARADYPLATLVAADGMPENGMYETKCGTRPGLGRTLTVSRLDDVAQAVRRIAEAEAAGAAVAWVRNTVDDAFAAVEALAAAGVSATLFHARAAMGDRLDVESRIIARFGKDGEVGPNFRTAGDERVPLL